LIIDTDPGVDDAQAILLATAHPNVKVEAIMAVGGNVGLHHTVRNALTIVEVVGQDIPVYAGCDQPLVTFSEDASDFHGHDGLGGVGLVPTSGQAESEHASLALLRMVNEAPGEYTLVAIGPLTNIAVALKLDPDLPSKIKRLVVMGGAVTGHGNTSNRTAEFNIFADPEAAHVVFESWGKAGKVLELVDWELTLRKGIPRALVEQWFTIDTPRARFFKAVSEGALAFTKKYYDHDLLWCADALALAVAVEPSCVREAVVHHVGIGLEGQYSRGQTAVEWRSNRANSPLNTSIVMEVDADRFHALMEAGLH
jgi:purine nucleosidase